MNDLVSERVLQDHLQRVREHETHDGDGHLHQEQNQKTERVLPNTTVSLQIIVHSLPDVLSLLLIIIYNTILNR